MIALDCIAPSNPKPIYEKLDKVLSAYEAGSVITVDHAVGVNAALCKADTAYERRMMPLFIRHFERCRAKEIPQYLQRVSVCLTPDNHHPLADVIQGRMGELTASLRARVRKIYKKLVI